MSKKTKKIISLFLLTLIVFSCEKKETNTVIQKQTYEYDKNSEQYSDKISDTLKQNKNEISKEVELPESTLIEKKDISIRVSMNSNAPINKRFTYKYLVPNTITKNQIALLLTKLLENIVQKDNDIDDVTIWLYSDKDLIDGSYDVGMATFKPSNGEVTKEIALSNDKSSYLANYLIADNFEEHLNSKSEKVVVSGLSNDLRKKIYKELANTETRAREKLDKIYPYTDNFDTDKYANKLDELTKKYEKEICKKYKIDNKTMNMIYEEGDKNSWYNF